MHQDDRRALALIHIEKIAELPEEIGKLYEGAKGSRFWNRGKHMEALRKGLSQHLGESTQIAMTRGRLAGLGGLAAGATGGMLLGKWLAKRGQKPQAQV